jgi:hypothetical protein
LDKLVPYPEQSRFFSDLGDKALKALADDIRREGLKCPIEVLPRNGLGLPANTIICGHQRRALQLNGHAEYQVLVRYDLADGPLGAVQRRFLEDNLNRRQLDDLDKARAAVAMSQVTAAGRFRDDLGAEYAHPKLIQRELGFSDRHARRILQILRTPDAVQRAYAAGLIPMHLACKVATLSREAREDLATALAATANPGGLIAAAVAGRRSDAFDARAVAKRLVRDADAIAAATPDDLVSLSAAARAALVAAVVKLKNVPGRLGGPGNRR